MARSCHGAVSHIGMILATIGMILATMLGECLAEIDGFQMLSERYP